MKIYLGRYVYGLAAILFGILAVTWNDFNLWQQVRPLGAFPGREILLYVVAAVEILGGVAVAWTATARGGAVALGIVYLFFAVLWLPLWLEKPLVYDRLANFFEQFSLVSGALILYATADSNHSPRAAKLARIGYYGFAACVVSFTLEQLIYLHGTAEFVPKWIPGQMFWAIFTTIAFALAAIALISGRAAVVASRLLTLMIVLFGVLVWLPAPFQHPHSFIAWAGNVENLAIAGAAWIVSDYLSASLAAKRVVGWIAPLAKLSQVEEGGS
jgi:uncharacterized membrane protein YphA (DoxX/SURF4 family)